MQFVVFREEGEENTRSTPHTFAWVSMMLYPMTVKCTWCHLVSTRNRRINRLSFNDNMFFYPEIRDENSRLGQRCLAQDARIKSVLAFAIAGLHSQRYLEHTTILPLDFANHWFVAFLYWSSASRIYLLWPIYLLSYELNLRPIWVSTLVVC